MAVLDKNRFDFENQIYLENKFEAERINQDADMYFLNAEMESRPEFVSSVNPSSITSVKPKKPKVPFNYYYSEKYAIVKLAFPGI